MTQITPFGTTEDGRDIAQIAIGSDLLAVKILTLGGVLNDVTAGRDCLAFDLGQFRGCGL